MINEEPSITLTLSPHSQPAKIIDGWTKSPLFGLYYPNTYSVIEYYSDEFGGQTTQALGSPHYAAISIKNSDTVISWGDEGICNQSDFEKFNYGASYEACIHGHKAWIAHFSARSGVSSQELKLFGDFVLNNQ